MANNSNPLNGYRFDTREKGIETRGEQFAKLVNGSSASNKEADAKQDKEIKKVANDLASFKKNVYTKSQADNKFLTEHQDLSEYAKKAQLNAYAKKADVYTKAEVDEKIPPEQDLSLYAKKADVYTKTEVDGLIPDVTGFALASDVESALAEKANATDLDAKANASDVYTKSEVDGLIPDVSEKVDWVESTPGRKHIVLANHDSILGTDTTGGTYNVAMVSKWNVADFGSNKLHMNLNSLDGNVTINDDKTIATVDQIPEMEQYYKKDEVDAMISEKNSEIYSLKQIVGEIGGNVTFAYPNELGKSFATLMKNNGTVKLEEDVEFTRYAAGIIDKNHVKLNLNGHNITSTSAGNYGAFLFRGTQEVTIGGKGTIEARDGICIQSLSKDCVVNLTGSTTIYHNNRSGGELIYCNLGTINITNGTFRNDGENKGFMINCYDQNRAAGTAKIVITGGKFYDFDPGNNSAEGPGTSFLADGYESVASTVVEDGVEHTVYTVKKIA